MKGLREIFNFYNEKSNSNQEFNKMNSSGFLKFCSDFDIPISTDMLKFILNKFNLNVMRFEDFLVALGKLGIQVG
jgi:hypothetical protein